MGLPIIQEVLDLVNKGVDKIWPDANEKEKIKADLQNSILQDAMNERKLLFEDTDSARSVFIEELKAQNTPKWARSIQVLGRQYALYATVSLYIWSKVSVSFNLPKIELSDRDYWLIGCVFVFLFGARTFEKMRGVDKN